jgi:hypothetical protein
VSRSPGHCHIHALPGRVHERGEQLMGHPGREPRSSRSIRLLPVKSGHDSPWSRIIRGERTS